MSTTTSLTKAQEIALLSECAAKLGPDSYCGPWLNERIQELESLIRSDVFPEITFKDAETRCAEILKAANDRATEIKQNAIEYANKEATLRHRSIERASEALRQALKTLESL